MYTLYTYSASVNVCYRGDGTVSGVRVERDVWFLFNYSHFVCVTVYFKFLFVATVGTFEFHYLVVIVKRFCLVRYMHYS